MRFFIVVLVSLLATCAHAATIARNTMNGSLVVNVTGPIVDGDYEKFLDAAGTSTNLRVVLQSEGGSVLTAIKIGTYIRAHGFSTLVAHDNLCASACAIIWMAGIERSFGAQAQVGFHAAYDVTNGNQITSVGNALIGAYFARIGLSDRAIAYLTAAAPSDMRWLSLADAESMGIDVRMLKGPRPPAPVVAGSSQPPATPAAATGPARELAGPAQSSAGATVGSPATQQADQPGSAAPPQTQRGDVRSLAGTSAAGGSAGADSAHVSGADTAGAVRTNALSASQ